MENKNPDEFPFEFRKKNIDQSLQKENWKEVETQIVQKQVPIVRLRWIRPAMVAASLLLIVGSVWYWIQATTRPEFSKISTEYGEVKRITLPDGSLVVLNANSTINIPDKWSEKSDRQLWLDGEAYFQITKKPLTKQKFIVHTPEIDIEVLGTKFNVNTRHKYSIVSLEEGKVQLSVHGNVKQLLEARQPVVMKPGDVAVINNTHKIEINGERLVKYRSGWSRNEFHFDGTTLSDIAKMIKDDYGYSMEANDKSLFQKKISGDLRAANLEELIKVLEVTFGIKMTVVDETIQVQQE